MNGNETRFDALALPAEGAKRDLEATAWANALATPGRFAGLSQVDKLFRASRVPWPFGTSSARWPFSSFCPSTYPQRNSFGHDNRARVKALVLTLRYSGMRIVIASASRRRT
jgi:hypothetical protein